MKKQKTSLIIHAIFILFSLACILPFMMIVSASLTSPKNLSIHGFSILPPEVDYTAYAYLFENPKQIIDSYWVTILITFIGTFLSVWFMSMTAYALARYNCRFKGLLTAYIFIPGLFSGGLVASYLVNTQYLHLTNSIWAMILPGLISGYNIFMMRTFFKQLPEGLFEAAQIDGAGEFRIYFTIALRLSKPVLATVAFLGSLSRWNTWHSAMLYIRSKELYPLQYLLQRMLMNMQELLEQMKHVPGAVVQTSELPGENLRMALLIVCIGPMMIFFPFFQKYFAKGMTVGAVKG